MVDLVKIRRKAKEKQEPSPADSAAEAPADESSREPSSGELTQAAREDVSEGPVTPDRPVEPAAEKAQNDGKPGKPQRKKNERSAEPRVKEKATEARDGEPPNSPEAEPSPAEAAEAHTPAPAPGIGEDADEASLDRLARFKRDAGKRRSWSVGPAKETVEVGEDDAARDLELLRFRLAGEEYAVDIEKIVEIVPPRATTRVPNADRSIVGIMSLRGTIVTVFDLRRKLGHPPIAEGQAADRRMIVVEREGETAGFLVDRVSRVVKLDRAELENHPVVSAAEQSDYVGGVFQAPDGLVILLDLEKILAGQS